MAIACPSCHSGTEHARAFTLYRSEPAPWYLRLLRLVGAPAASMVDRAVGFAVVCQRCGHRFCIGDGGPRDTWSLKEPRGQEPPAPSNSKPREDVDPAEDHLMRTTRRPGLV